MAGASSKLIGRSGDDTRTSYEVMTDVSRFIQEVLDGYTSAPPPLERADRQMNWLRPDGRVEFDKLPRRFLEQVFACLTPREKRMFGIEYRGGSLDDVGADAPRAFRDRHGETDAASMVYRHFRRRLAEGTASAIDQDTMSEVVDEIQEWAEGESPMGEILLDYFYATDAEYRLRIDMDFASFSRGCDVAAIKANQDSRSKALVQRLELFANIGPEDLFEDVDAVDEWDGLGD